MDKLRPKHFFWKIYGTICIPLGFYYMPQLLYLLTEKAVSILLNPGEGAGVALAIPGVRIPGSPIYIPLFYGIAAIGILALVHEMAHGIIGKSEGIKINNSGFGFFLIFPLFFVEPDEKSLIKASKLSRLRMMSAGSGTNIIVSFLLLSLLSVTLLPFFVENTVVTGIEVTGVMNDFPAQQANITEGMLITGIDGIKIENLTRFNELLTTTYSPGDELIINTDSGNFSVKTTNNPSNESLPYLGIFLNQLSDYSVQAKTVYGEPLLAFLRIIYDLLIWVGFLNLSIGIMNLLPIWGLDGSKMLYDLLSYVMSEKRAKTITSFISSFCIGLLIINIAPVFIGLFY
jgi:membrane-associated protease RseP (regulator of RpoE activity)